MPTNNDWIGNASIDANDDDNWSLGHKPTSGEVARLIDDALEGDYPNSITGGARTWGGLYIDTGADPNLSFLSGVTISGNVTVIQNLSHLSLNSIDGNLASTVGCNLMLGTQHGDCVYSGDCVVEIDVGSGAFKWSSTAIETETSGVATAFTGVLIADTKTVHLAGSVLNAAVQLQTLNGGRFVEYTQLGAITLAVLQQLDL